MRFLFLLAGLALVPMPSYAADFRTTTGTQQEVDELQRRCDMHAKNDKKPYRLMWGRVTRTHFAAPQMEPCEPSEEVPCPKPHWFPRLFSAYFTDTNVHGTNQPVEVFVSDKLRDDYVEDLNFTIGKTYVLCGTDEPRRHAKTKPRFQIHNFYTIYEVVKK